MTTDIGQAIIRAFGRLVHVGTIPAGITVGTGFTGPDGDGIGFTVVPAGDGWRITDGGHTVPLIEAEGVDLRAGPARRAFDRLVSAHGAAHDEESGEIRTPVLSADAVPDAAVVFTALLLRMQDLRPPMTGAAPSFRRRVLRHVRGAFDGKAEIAIDAALGPAGSLYPADVVLRAGGRSLGIFLAAGDDRVVEAVAARAVARAAGWRDCRVVAMVGARDDLSDLGRARAAAGLDGVIVLDDQPAEAMVRLADLLPLAAAE